MMSTVTALALIAAGHCVSPSISPVMVGIGQHESGLQATAIHDNTSGRSYFPDTTTQAIAISQSLLAIGHNLDLGISQVNIKNFRWTGLTLENAFDACTNFAAGSKVLFAKYNGSPPDAIKAAYAQKVSQAVEGLTYSEIVKPIPNSPLRDLLHEHQTPQILNMLYQKQGTTP